jgi:hypothetical protein
MGDETPPGHDEPSEDGDPLPDHATQHPNESVGFAEVHDCRDGFYETMRQEAIRIIEEKAVLHDNIDPRLLNIKELHYEDGTLSFEATHPQVTHELELDGPVPEPGGE